MNTTTIFFYVGVVLSSFIILSAIAAYGAFMLGYICRMWGDGISRYRRSKFRKKHIARSGLDCAEWLIRYNLYHGGNRYKFTARDWEKYFHGQINNQRNERQD